MELSSNDRTLRQILGGSFFEVPRYQRPYSWSPENVDELWEDVVQEADGDYFIGSMVVHATPGGLAVIDGQQRLTTVVMVLCAIRDAADRLGFERLGNGTHNLVERRDEDDAIRPVLRNDTAHLYFADAVIARGEPELGGPRGAEEAAIQKAYVKLKEKVQGVVDAVDRDPSVRQSRKQQTIEARLREIREKVLSLRVVFVEAGNYDDATTVFVTLNSRGKDLEPSDLVKAQLLTQLPKRGNLDRPHERWQKVVGLFDESAAQPDMTEFILAVWRSRYSAVSRKKLDKVVRARIRRRDAERFLSELERDAPLYRQILEPGFDKPARQQHSSVVESLRFMADFKIRLPHPLVLWLLRAHATRLISPRQLTRTVRAIEDYHFTYNVLVGLSSSGGMSAFYVSRAQRLTEAADANARARLLDDTVAELKRRRPSGAEFEIAFADLRFTAQQTAHKRTIQYILRRLHEHYVPRAATSFDKLTIEHIAPQSVGGDRVGEIGNLILVSEGLNGRLADKPFAAKQRLLSEADGEWIPPEILEASQWGKRAIRARTRQLARVGRTRIWR